MSDTAPATPEAPASTAIEVLPPESPDRRQKDIYETEETQRNVGESLRRMGLTKRMTKRVFASRIDGKILKREVCGRISLVYFANNLDQLALIQKKAINLARRKGLEGRDVAAALSVGVQAGNAIANVGVVFMDAAGDLDAIDRTPAPAPKTVINQQFNYPPVAGTPPVEQATSGA